MTILILGMIVFIGMHLVPTFQDFRGVLVRALGENKYKLLFTLISLGGLILIVLGKYRAEYVHLYTPPPWGRHAAYPLMLFALWFLVAKNLPSNLPRLTRHPMLWGVTLWALAHLLANGDLASTILFGGFGLFAIFDMWSANRRGARKSAVKVPVVKELMVAGVGVLVFGAFLYLHPIIFGVAVV